ncbi:MAG: hypothetical protein EOP04_02395 [Proteobacteria bacterium]|nr:MAG: hypothetical protein EOP04_02395 [Pseudomonadota bacterium]
MKTLFALFTTLTLSNSAFAAAKLAKDLPKKDFHLVESIPSIKSPKFRFEIAGSRYRLIANLSPTWEGGLNFDTKDVSLSIPGLGAGPLKAEADGYSWTVQDSGQSFRKDGKLRIIKTPNGCTMTWEFFILVNGQAKVKEQGSLAYSCSSGDLSATANPLVDGRDKISRSDLFPSYVITPVSTGSQLGKIFEGRSTDLNACISRNINRPSTLTDHNEYASDFKGNVAYRLRDRDGKLEAAPYLTTNDARMDSCVIDLIQRVETNRILGSFAGEKYLVFDVRCTKNSEDKKKPHNCEVRHSVFDTISQ